MPFLIIISVTLISFFAGAALAQDAVAQAVADVQPPAEASAEPAVEQFIPVGFSTAHEILLTAAGRGDIATVKKLIEEAKLYVHYKNPYDGRTALHLAAEGVSLSHIAIVQYLVKAGLGINDTDLKDRTPLLVAIYHSIYRDDDMSRNRMIPYLLSQGADRDARIFEVTTATEMVQMSGTTLARIVDELKVEMKTNPNKALELEASQRRLKRIPGAIAYLKSLGVK